ncbi:hypothetical protein HELRODRAFT_194808 [Helobdella robusta]|uniref:ADAMTS cysteine-rich domain-containing protein n=1 Tax=Helobdella robusta TaxID=6412 RepID=T1FWF6_HELRO|nr:hypothetical protein HELRODRAFT_194808 [Helobdella robusta]ESO11405.1 hypothetical protein HELRODRAFT_194808 [Helobdella robusta]
MRSTCNKMSCWVPKLNRCESPGPLHRAFDGTPCTSGMWCQEGKCVKNSLAPVYEGACRYGDKKGGWALRGADYPSSCEDVLKKFTWNCYEEPYKTDCCKACATVKAKFGQEKCEYGDRFSSRECRPSVCGDRSWRTYCCTTCSDVSKKN